MIPARYAAYCPNCGGEAESERLAAGLACARCQPDPQKPPLPGALAHFAAQEKALADWTRFFTAQVGAPPWPRQRAWTARVVQGRSFAMLAPTGIGKTTFGLLTASWLAREGRRSYLVFPTRLLVAQAAERLRALGASFTAYTGKPREKEALLEGEHPIGLFTVAFLHKNHARLPRPVDFLFVDDVDSLLKSARNVDRVLGLLGFAPEDVEKGLALVRLRRRHPEEAERRAERLRGKARGVLAVASATARPHSPRVHLFRELLGFEVGTPSFALRKVADLYEEAFGLSQEELWARGAEWAGRLGKGGLFFLPGDLPKEAALDLARFLRARGLRARAYLEPEALEAFRRGEADHLVGFASWRNPLPFCPSWRTQGLRPWSEASPGGPGSRRRRSPPCEKPSWSGSPTPPSAPAWRKAPRWDSPSWGKSPSWSSPTSPATSRPRGGRAASPRRGSPRASPSSSPRTGRPSPPSCGGSATSWRCRPAPWPRRTSRPS